MPAGPIQRYVDPSVPASAGKNPRTYVTGWTEQAARRMAATSRIRRLFTVTLSAPDALTLAASGRQPPRVATVPWGAVNRLERIGLPAVLALSLALNVWNINFPLGYHIDEPVKVGFIQTDTQDFKHPILLLQLARAVCALFSVYEDQQIVVAGRAIQAVAATLTVAAVFFLARRTFRNGGALAVATSVAVAPILVMHAHYLKEDMQLGLWTAVSLLSLVRYAERPVLLRTALLGISLGLAFSSHYKSILLVPLVAVTPLLGILTAGSEGERQLRFTRFLRDMVIAGIVATAVFLVVNYPLLRAAAIFFEGSGFELQHALEGEDARYRLTEFWFTFHLRYSLARGLGWPALIAALAGAAVLLFSWRRLTFVDRLVLACAFFFYVVQEASPLKAARYMVPVTPALLYLGWRGLTLLAERMKAPQPVAYAALVVVLVGLPAYRSVRLVSSISNDTRARAAAWLRDHPGKAQIEQYGGLAPTIWSAVDEDLAVTRSRGVDYVVTSSLQYGRYLAGATLRDQDAEVYEKAAAYRALFAYPYVEILPPFESYEFTNPVIRIVDIRSAPAVPRTPGPAGGSK